MNKFTKSLLYHFKSGGGGGGDTKVNASTANSAFDGINHVSSNIVGLGETRTVKDGSNSIKTINSIDSDLERAVRQSQAGLNTGLADFNRPLTDLISEIDNGQNLNYNLNREIMNKELDRQRGATMAQFANAGRLGSSTLGGFLGAQAGDAALQDMALRSSIADQITSRAQNQIATNFGINQGIIGMQMPNAQMTSTGLFDAMGSQDQMAMFNAQQQQQASMQNAQIAAQQQAQASKNRSSLMGNLIGGATSLAAIPLTAGMSAAFGLPAAAGAAGGAGGAFSILNKFVGSKV